MTTTQPAPPSTGQARVDAGGGTKLGTTAAEALRPAIDALLGDGAVDVGFELWDGSRFGPDDAGVTLRIHSPNALRRLLWAPGELGVGRAYVAGDIDIDGDAVRGITALRDVAPSNLRFGIRAVPALLRAAHRLGALGRPLAPPSSEIRQRGRMHSKSRDARAISHHYDVGNDFYRLVLGPSMTYSCARFVDDGADLAEAQTAKHELVCRKLGLHERAGKRLLDVGCGWGSMAIHAAAQHGATVVGITISEEQAAAARRRVAEAGLGDRIEIRLQDYRDLRGEQFDAISSIGMFEHVGSERVSEYFSTLHGLLGDHGRLLNHAISSSGGSRISSRSFIGRYVFPDGELVDVGEVVLAMERAGFEVRDVESLREHYASTLRAWVANLEARWDDAVRMVGIERARVWRMYMAASAVGFTDGGIALHQVLGVRPDGTGDAAMPPTRAAWG